MVMTQIGLMIVFAGQLSLVPDSVTTVNGSHLYFLPNNDILSVARTVERITRDSSEYYDSKLMVLSFKDGRVKKEIVLEGAEMAAIVALAVATDGSSFALLSSSGPRKWIGPPSTLALYSLDEDRWAWSIRWPADQPCLRLTYDENNQRIICVSTQSTTILDAESGSVIRTSDAISSLGVTDSEYLRYDLSGSGRYFAFWSVEFLRFSHEDELGILRLLDVSWIGLRWLFHLGKIPHWLFVWDVYQDKLLCKIPIPYRAVRGTPAFSHDERELVVGPFDGRYSVFSVDSSGILIREYSQNDSLSIRYEERSLYFFYTDYKVLSCDNKYLAVCYGMRDIFLLDHQNGMLILKWKQGTPLHPFDKYAMSFSPDNEHFAIVAKGGRILLYETVGWKEVWESDPIGR